MTDPKYKPMSPEGGLHKCVCVCVCVRARAHFVRTHIRMSFHGYIPHACEDVLAGLGLRPRSERQKNRRT